MEIIEADFKIKYEGACYVLFLKKSKKEAKPDPKEPYKIGGYYNYVHNALKAVYDWRETKKYPFKESATELKETLKKHNVDVAKLNNIHTTIYESIYKLKKEIFDEYNKLQCELRE